jgi:hypothetical protein
MSLARTSWMGDVLLPVLLRHSLIGPIKLARDLW